MASSGDDSTTFSRQRQKANSFPYQVGSAKIEPRSASWSPRGESSTLGENPKEVPASVMVYVVVSTLPRFDLPFQEPLSGRGPIHGDRGSVIGRRRLPRCRTGQLRRSVWPSRVVAAGALHRWTYSRVGSPRFTRPSQNVVAASTLSDKLLEAEGLSERRTHQEIRGLLNFAVQQQAESSTPRHWEPRANQCTASTQVENNASLGQPPGPDRGTAWTSPFRHLGMQERGHS